MNHQEKSIEISLLLAKGKWQEALEEFNKIDKQHQNKVIRGFRAFSQLIDAFAYEVKNP
jgi:outer membrane protein assembly factor BamD (BamD/ComL family)